MTKAKAKKSTRKTSTRARKSSKKKTTIREPRKKTVEEVIAEYKADVKVEEKESPQELPEEKKQDSGLRPPAIPRRRLRYILFRAKRDVLEGMDRDLRELAPALKEFFDSELARKGLTWAGFTFTWDVAPEDVFDIIGPSLHDWINRGGMFEGRPGAMSEAEWAKHVVAEGLTARRKPPAFTRQE